MIDCVRRYLVVVTSIVLTLYTLVEANYALLPPLSERAVFALLGVALCFLSYPLVNRWKEVGALRIVDLLLALAFAGCCGYLIFEGTDLSQRAGHYTNWDIIVGAAGILLVLEATRRSIGWTLPILSGLFLVYAYFGQQMPDWLFPHRGYDINRLVAQIFLRTEGVFGFALAVMFKYVFLFVIFGAFLEITGCTQFIIDFAERLFGRFRGGPAMVSVVGSGLMGSLSGSAVANAVTTGTFTIPMMRNAGFSRTAAGGITAAAASGGALMPPVMGAGAYMMLELVPNITFVQIMKAAIVPAMLYYFSLLAIVLFYSARVGAEAGASHSSGRGLIQFEGLIFFGSLSVLIVLLAMGRSPFLAVTYSLVVILAMMIVHPRINVQTPDRWLAGSAFVGLTCLNQFYFLAGGEKPPLWENSAALAAGTLLVLGLFHPRWRPIVRDPLVTSARQGTSLVAASACVGIIIGVVTLTGVGTAFPNAIVPLAEQSLLAALVAIMACSIVLGMGLPSAVCYLLMATLIGPVLNRLGVAPLAAHLFIFYFGMMSMVTPPVALAAYASASIAGSNIIKTSFSAFQFALVGFTLPFMFVYRPELLLMGHGGDPVYWLDVVVAIVVAIFGVTALAAAIAGYLFSRLGIFTRVLAYISAGLSLYPSQWTPIEGVNLGVSDIVGIALFFVIAVISGLSALRQPITPTEPAQPEPATT